MNIIKELKGGSLSKTIVIDDGQRLLVRKYVSSIENREYGLVRWQSQIRRMQILKSYLGERVISIESMGVDGSFYYYDMPFYENALDCHNSKEYQEGWKLAKDTTKRNLQIIKGFNTE